MSTSKSKTTDSRIKFWVDAWEPWPLVFDTEEDALADGEASRQKEIKRLEARIERVRTAPLTVERYDPSEDVTNDE